MSDFRVDNVPFSPTRLSATHVRQIAKAAEAAGQWAAPHDTWGALAERTEKNNALDGRDYSQIRKAKGKALEFQGKLIDRLVASKYTDTQLAKKISGLQTFIAGATDLTDTVRLEQARIAFQAAGGAQLGAAGLATAYVGTKWFQQQDVNALCAHLKDLESGHSAQLIPGNHVEAVHHEEVWPKMLHMVDDAIASAKAGKPVEIEAQYFELSNPEFLGKLAQAAQAGNHVRVNVDPGRLQPFQTAYKIDEIPVKLNALLQLQQAGVAISCYPVEKELGSVENLMHRKVLRVGDEVLLSGMNANEGSGENIDGGYVVKGPAAARLGENLNRDIQSSRAAGFQQIYGAGKVDAAVNGLRPHIGGRGLVALFDCASGPSAAGTALPKAESCQQLEGLAQKAGYKLGDLLEVPAGQTLQAYVDKSMRGEEGLQLSARGAAVIDTLMHKMVDLCSSPDNLTRIDAVGPVDGTPCGNTVLGISDIPQERDALLMHGIAQAEEFIYIPAYIMTRPVAAALAERKKELEAQGKHLDVRVVVDSAVFPDEGSPNTLGAVRLEDVGIPVRWVTLPRSSDHDRKLHAKGMLTDKGEYFGSTNFSNKGLKENWEESGMVMFDPNDPESMKLRDDAKGRFLRLWDQMSVEVDSHQLAKVLAAKSGGGPELEEALREESLRGVIAQIQKFEEESATFMAERASQPEVAARFAELHRNGMDEGSALLLSVEQTMGSDAFFRAMAELPSHQALADMVRPSS